MAWDDTKVANTPTDTVNGRLNASDWNDIVSAVKARILHSLSTAENDVLVGSGSNSFIKKTLAEFKTILGLGSAAYTPSTAYEPANSNIQSHISSTSNPHSVTKTQVSLGNVDDVQQMPLAYLDTDGTLAANSDSKIASQKAVKCALNLRLIPSRMAYFLSSVTDSSGVEKSISPTFPSGTWDTVLDGFRYNFNVFSRGTETILIINTYKSTNRGIFDLYIDGVLNTGGYDDYAASAITNIRKITITPMSIGEHIIQMRVNSKNSASTGYSLSPYWVMLT